jgi:hypothetical protein
LSKRDTNKRAEKKIKGKVKKERNADRINEIK